MTSLPYAPGSDTSRDAAETGKTNAVAVEWLVTFVVNGLCESVRLLDFHEASAISRAKHIARMTGTDVSTATKITAERV